MAGYNPREKQESALFSSRDLEGERGYQAGPVNEKTGELGHSQSYSVSKPPKSFNRFLFEITVTSCSRICLGELW
jgi:hypothetical protein